MLWTEVKRYVGFLFTDTKITVLTKKFHIFF